MLHARYFYLEKTNDLTTRLFEKSGRIKLDLLCCLTLLDKLERDGLILIHSDFGFNPESLIINPPKNQKKKDEDTLWFSISDEKILSLLIKYSISEIIPTPTLRKLKENNFKSLDEIKFGKTIKVAWAGVISSLILGILSQASSYFNKDSSEKRLQEVTKIIEDSHSELGNSVRTKFRESTTASIDNDKSDNIPQQDTNPISQKNDLRKIKPEDLILQIQQHLNYLGFNAGPEDGKFGIMTLKAIKAFQAEADQEDSGIPSLTLLERLKVAAKG